LLVALALAAPAAGAPCAPLPPIQVILVGDSTIATNSGYGDALCARFTPEVTCVNVARAGRSSASYRAEGHWTKVEQMLRDGKQYSARYVLIQFGHNDQPGKPGHSTDLVTGFPVNLARYVDETVKLGGVPVLVTPLTRRTFKGPYLRDTLGPWAEATRRVAAQQHVALLDLNADSITAVERMGQEQADTLAVAPPPPNFYAVAGAEPAKPVKTKFDWTHLGRKGADLFSGMVAGELTRTVPGLAPYLMKD
jgi:lysophospholipase L1-like esterase